MIIKKATLALSSFMFFSCLCSASDLDPRPPKLYVHAEGEKREKTTWSDQAATPTDHIMTICVQTSKHEQEQLSQELRAFCWVIPNQEAQNLPKDDLKTYVQVHLPADSFCAEWEGWQGWGLSYEMRVPLNSVVIMGLCDEHNHVVHLHRPQHIDRNFLKRKNPAINYFVNQALIEVPQNPAESTPHSSS